jgi:uncharacterized protein YndB with AHSA1/START domain
MDVPDAIERELILPVPPQRVWEALTRPDQLGQWFGTRAVIDALEPGAAIVFIWDGSGGITGTNRGVIEVVEPPRRFAFRWQMGEAQPASTRVEFVLEPHPAGTRLRLTESGFASLPPEVRARCRRDNEEGWQHELGDLMAYLSAGPVA